MHRTPHRKPHHLNFQVSNSVIPHRNISTRLIIESMFNFFVFLQWQYLAYSSRMTLYLNSCLFKEYSKRLDTLREELFRERKFREFCKFWNKVTKLNSSFFHPQNCQFAKSIPVKSFKICDLGKKILAKVLKN